LKTTERPQAHYDLFEDLWFWLRKTYPSLIGLDASKELAEKLYQQAIASIATISDNTPPLNKHTALDSTQLLRNLADLVVKRRN